MSGYGSRKFIVTMTGMLIAGVLAWNTKMTGDVAMVLIACIGGYHVANAYTTGQGNGES